MDPLTRVAKEIEQCVKCGACRAHCPVFTEMGREPSVARGKIAIAKWIASGGEPDEPTRAVLSKCLLCGSCTEKCSNDVPTDEIVIAAREHIARRRGLSSFHRAVREVLKRRWLMSGGAILASLLRPFLFRKIPGASGLRLRIPFPFGGMERRSFPAVAARSFIDSHPENVLGQRDKPTVLLFTGCMTNFVYTEIGEAALKLLEAAGCTVVIPKEQQCCGYPALSGGDSSTFADLAMKNLQIFRSSSADFIMTPCASCGNALKALYPSVLGKIRPELYESCVSTAERTVDASSLLQQVGFIPEKEPFASPVKITYHDPCHLRRLKVRKEPRQLLRAVSGTTFVEMDHADSCCGLGGTFNVYHYDTSMAINRKKTEAINRTGADCVVTGCPGCIMQLRDGLSRSGSGISVMHTLQFLAKTLR